MSSPRKVAFIDSPRSQEYWGNDMQGRNENELIATQLKDLNIEVEIVPWYEKNNWDRYSHLIMRSPSDLYFYEKDFRNWIRSVSHIPMFNSAEIIEWNMDKHYLKDLQAKGVNVAPTTFVEIGDSFQPPDQEYVIKPVTSGGGANSGRFDPSQEPEAHDLINSIHSNGHAAIVQPYLQSVDIRGEVDLIFFNEVFDHAIIKGAVLSKESDGSIPEISHPNPKVYEPTKHEIALAKKAIEVTPREETLLYARIDMADDNDGNPSIMELEYIDPVLFLTTSEDSASRFAQSIAEKIN